MTSTSSERTSLFDYSKILSHKYLSMTFYCIAKESENISVELLRTACEKRSVDFVVIRPEGFDFTDAPRITAGDCLYRVSANDLSAIAIEKFLFRQGVSTLRITSTAYLPAIPSSFFSLPKKDVPIPKTIPTITKDRDLLKRYAAWLGGFPIILKAVGNSLGIGVIRVDSLESLYSLVDYLEKVGGNYILREFISVRESARLAVLGDHVIGSIQYSSKSSDFRSNQDAQFIPLAYPESVQEIAVRAVQAKGLEFGGVDILIDKHGDPYVLEVNFPFSFPDIQKAAEVDVASAMVDYLIAKADRVLSGN